MSVARVANAPCSWGVLEFESKVGALRYGRVLDEMAVSGYAGTELGDWGFLPTSPRQLREALHERGLTLMAAFLPVSLADPAAHAKGLDRARKIGQLLAAVGDSPMIVLSDDNGGNAKRTRNAGRIRIDQGLTEAEWGIFAEAAERIARVVLDEAEVRTVFHPHCAGFVETPREVEALLDRTDPELLGLCLDTGHCTYGGGSAVQALRSYAERIWHVHFKDMQPQVAERARNEKWDYFQAVERGLFCELGQGAVDFRGVLAELTRLRYSGWIVVEQDVLPGLGTPLESARRNRAFLRSLGL